MVACAVARARRSLLWTLQRSQTHKADVVIIVHPKSGGTWLRVMLFRLYQRKYDLPARRVMKTDELQRLQRSLPRFVISNGHYSYEAAVREILLSEQGKGKRLVFLARNPCDIAVSWYLQFTRRISAPKRELEEANYFHNAGLRLKDRTDPNSYKVRRGKVGGFRDYFEPAQADAMEAMVRERLHPALRYGEVQTTHTLHRA